MIIDAHCHYLPLNKNVKIDIWTNLIETYSNAWGIPIKTKDIEPTCRKIADDLTTYDNFVQRMKQAGIDKAILFHSDNKDQEHSDEEAMNLNTRCNQITQRHPDKFIPFASIDPRRPKAPALFRQCIENLNMKGLKWHPDYGFYPNSEEAYRVLQVASDLDVPLITHTGPFPPYRLKYALPIHLDDVAWEFPKLKIVAAHMGDTFWRDWVGIAKYKKNIYGDLSMWQYLAETDLCEFRRRLREIIDVVGLEYVLFATDAPAFEPVISNNDWVDVMKSLPNDDLGGVKFTEKEVKAIMGGNAVKILNL
jgi:predicted TIM-barrel fold metal-dependent hydrolase